MEGRKSVLLIIMVREGRDKSEDEKRKRMREGEGNRYYYEGWQEE